MIRREVYLRRQKFMAYVALPFLASSLVFSFSTEESAKAATTVPSVSIGKQPTCAWVLSGISSALTMSAPGTYNPATTLTFTGTDATASMYVSGDASVGTACSWYGTTKNAAINISIPDNSGFSGTPAGLDFSFTSGNPLTYLAARGTGCPVGGTFAVSQLNLYGTSATTLGTALTYSTAGGSTTTAACLFTPYMTSKIPSGLTPGGETTNLTGSTITTTLTVS
ncbi:MAG: hypothetical protein RL359_332 [Actinomycetota bacterium]